MQWLELSNLFFLYLIPAILIFYLLKRKYEDLEISSTLLWNKMLRDLEANKPWQKLRKNLLLLLQLLLAAFLIIALLRPAIPSENQIANHTIIILDSSSSMLTIEGNETRFEIAKKEIKGLIENLSNEQSITLIEMGQVPKVHITKSSNKNELLNALESIIPREGIGDDYAAFSLARSIAANEPNSGIMWFGDGANYELNSKNEQISSDIPFKHVQVGKKSENIALSTFVTQQENNNTRGLIRVDNFGNKEKDATVSIYDFSGSLLSSTSFVINGNSSYSLELDKIEQSTAYLAKLETIDDGLLEDNQLWSVPYSRGLSQAMLVSEEGNHFLFQALNTGQLIQVEKMTDYQANTNKEADIWIFDGYVPENLPEGNIFLIGPENKTKWLQYYGEKELKYKSEVIKPSHELLKYVNWDNVHISKIKDIDKPSGMEALIKAEDDPIMLAGNIDNRRVVILAFDIHNSDLPLRTAFPILIQNTINWLSPEKSSPIGTSHPGEKLIIPFTPGSDNKIVTTPSNNKIELNNSENIVKFNVPEETGLYKVDEIKNNETETRYFSIGLNQQESDIKPESIKIFITQSNDTETGEDSSLISKGYVEIAEWFILLALIVAFIEWVVYKRGY